MYFPSSIGRIFTMTAKEKDSSVLCQSQSEIDGHVHLFAVP